MQGDFITSIKSAYNQFTKAEKKVADYILAKSKGRSVYVHYRSGGGL